MSLLEDVGSLLTTAGVASTSAAASGWRLCYRDFQPGHHVRQVVVVPTGGYPQDGKAPIDRPTFQLLVRDSSAGAFPLLETKVQAAIDCLNCYTGTVNGRYYVDIQKQGDAAFLGRDDNQRPIVSLNFLAVRSRTT